MSTGPGRDAEEVCEQSYDWYARQAKRARWAYQLSETLLLLLAASIPASAALAPRETSAPAVLGALVVALTGLRSVFHWQDNYVRFSAARQAVDQQRRLYRIGAPPYDDPARRDQLLVARICEIEELETGQWMKLASERPRA